MKVVTAWFDMPGQNRYKRLLDVFLYSVKKNMPDATLEVLNIKPMRGVGIDQHLANNRAKMETWAQIDITEPTILADCDMLVLQDLSVAFDVVEDVGLTYRTADFPPRNGGMIFLQPTVNANRFLKQWNKVDRFLYGHRIVHELYRKKYAGMNQASLGYLLESGILPTLNVTELPCSIWNACNEDWPNISRKTKAVHIKGKNQLRGDALSDKPIEDIEPSRRKAVMLWRQYEREAKI